MAESDDQEDDGDTGSDLRVEETEHTVIDAELGALIRAAAEEKARAEEQSITSESALAGLGPAFPSEDTFSIEEPDISTRVIEAASTDPASASERSDST